PPFSPLSLHDALPISGTVPSALLRAVAATAGFTPAIRHGEAMQALGRALAEEGREADAIAALRRAVLAFRDSGDRARLAGALTRSEEHTSELQSRRDL